MVLVTYQRFLPVTIQFSHTSCAHNASLDEERLKTSITHHLATLHLAQIRSRLAIQLSMEFEAKVRF